MSVQTREVWMRQIEAYYGGKIGYELFTRLGNILRLHVKLDDEEYDNNVRFQRRRENLDRIALGILQSNPDFVEVTSSSGAKAQKNLLINSLSELFYSTLDWIPAIANARGLSPAEKELLLLAASKAPVQSLLLSYGSRFEAPVVTKAEQMKCPMIELSTGSRLAIFPRVTLPYFETDPPVADIIAEPLARTLGAPHAANLTLFQRHTPSTQYAIEDKRGFSYTSNQLNENPQTRLERVTGLPWEQSVIQMIYALKDLPDPDYLHVPTVTAASSNLQQV